MFIVNGHRQPSVRNARHEPARAAKLRTAATGLEVPATGAGCLPQTRTFLLATRRKYGSSLGGPWRAPRTHRPRTRLPDRPLQLAAE